MTSPIAATLLRAAELTAAGQPEAAIALLEPLVEEYPGHSEAWCRLAAAQLDAGGPEASLDSAKRAMRLGERSWAHRLASLALLELGRDDEAVVSAREAVRRDPGDWRCQVTLAQAAAVTEPGEARAAAQEAIRLAPEQPRTHEILAEISQTPQRKTPQRQPRRPIRSTRRAGFGRVAVISWWLLVRRLALWLGLGSFVLLLAGLPTPSSLLAWFGLVLLIFVLGLAGKGWLDLPRGARLRPRQLWRAQPVLTVAAGLTTAAAALLGTWTLTVALGARGLQLLVIVLACSAVPGTLAWLALRRGLS